MLDRIDRSLVSALQNNARLSNKELAARVGLAPSSCLERVRRLQSSGVIRGVHADIDPHAVGIGLQAMVAIRLGQHARETLEALRNHLVERPEVVAMYHVGGAADFLIHVAVRDTTHLRDFAFDQLTSRPEVAHLETSLIYEHTHCGLHVADEPEVEPKPRRRTTKRAPSRRRAKR
ncbi:MAG: Lrp/AsnC family transcriptional regulator [Myxococcota bacterium]